MTTSELRQRGAPPSTEIPEPNLAAGAAKTAPALESEHPSGEARYGRFRARIRALTVALYFGSGALVVHLTQILGSPLYLISRDLYYAYMSLTKASFGLLITTMTQWWAPTIIRMSGDASVAGQLSLTADGRVQCEFPERMVMIANHQIYTDWLYLWWVGYTAVPQMHGHVYIILKESLRWIPILGPGCMYLGFIFMSRKMAVDQPRLAHRLGKLKARHTDPLGNSFLNPMWLLLFPEGTNLSGNGRRKSAAWAAKSGLRDPQHLLLPRSTGMYFCLSELKGTVDYVYDCTVAYEGIPRGRYGEEFFTLPSTFFQGRPPKSVNFYWRRFAVADIPLDNNEEFDKWLLQRWYEKDELMEHYIVHNRFPANDDGRGKHLETEVKTKYWWEFVKIYVMLGTFVLLFNFLLNTLRRFLRLA